MNKLKLFLATLLLAVTFTGCGYDFASSASYNEKIYVDEETGVNYIFLFTNNGVSMNPRYNADGSLYVSK